MDFRYLGNSGLRVAQICLGTMDFGAKMSDATARKVVDTARVNQVNFIDTADAYSNGASEKIVGKLIKKDWAVWVLAKKVGQQDGPPERKCGLSRSWMMEAIDGGLARLGTDYVDIHYMPHSDRDTPIGESVAALGDIIASGKAFYWGGSNHYGWEVAEIIRQCDQLGVPRPVVSQSMYNLAMLMPENDHLPACEYFSIGVVPFSPLARGVLTGKHDPKKAPPKGSRVARGDGSVLNRDMRKETFAAVEKICKHAAKRGMTPADFAVLWVLNNRVVTSVIAGPCTPAQWKAYLCALKHTFTAEDKAFVDGIVAAGHPASPGLIWNRHPPMGRAARTG